MTLTPGQVELISGVLSFFFTVALLSYLIGDNPLYRLALHIFIGVSVGYVALVVLYQVLVPRLATPLLSGNPALIGLTLVPLVLFAFLALKISPKTAAVGNISLAFLLGVGVAVAVGGAVTGTLFPQIRSTWLSVMPGAEGGFLNNMIIIIGTVTTLLYFQFWLRDETVLSGAMRIPIMRFLADIGQGFVVLTLATIYGGMILSGIAIFSERLIALYRWVAQFLL